MERYQAIIFDFNGVVVDDLRILETAYLQAARELGFPLSSKTARDYIAYAPEQKRAFYFGDISDQQWEELVRTQTRFYFELADKTDLVIPHVREILYSLSKSYTLALISNTPREYFDRICPQDLAALFKETMLGDEVEEPKPSPEPLIAMLKRLGLRKEQCCYVGDSVLDIEMSKSVGIFAFAVATGANSIEELKRAGADDVLTSLGELEKRLGSMQ